MVFNPELIDRSLRKRLFSGRWRARCKHFRGPMYAFPKPGLVDLNAQIGTRTQKVGLLVGFHAKERVARVEKDCPCGSVHAGGAFELQPGGPSRVMRPTISKE